MVFTRLRPTKKSQKTPLHTVLTVSLIIEGHQLNAVQPEQHGVGVCGVDPGGCWVGPQQLTRGVLDQLLRVTPAQPLGGILIDGGDVITLGCADDGAEGGGWVEDGRRLFLPAQALGTTYRKEREKK